MKKTLILLLAIALMLSLIACGSPTATQDSPPETRTPLESTRTQTQTPPPATTPTTPPASGQTQDSPPPATQGNTPQEDNTPDADPGIALGSEWNYGITPSNAPTYVVIGEYMGSDAHVEIPAMLEDLPVRVINTVAFAGNTSIVSVVIPENVTEIRTRAFRFCTSLESVTLPKSIQEIDAEAFGECTSLTEIIIPDDIDEGIYVHEYAFVNTGFSEETQNMLTERFGKLVFKE